MLGHDIPDAAIFNQYEECSYIDISINTQPNDNRLSAGLFRTWEKYSATDLMQVNLKWECFDGAHGLKIFLISCFNEKYQIYSGSSQSNAERRKHGHTGWADNWAGQPPAIKSFEEKNDHYELELTNYLIENICTK
ncbi:MAG TPA: hypothetical protein QGG70_04220 [Candidatus Pacearchaeota archaeon]|nr:hypothetical protein [Candidatus Pacearchaeota archaeon]